MMTIGVVSLARTRLPGCTCSRPVLPVSGARIVAYCSWTFAFSTAARSAPPSRRAPRRWRRSDRPAPCVAMPRCEEILVARRLRLARWRPARVAVERRLRLLQRRFERPLVERDEDLALLHLVAFVEVDRRQLAGDLRVDRDGRRGDHRADALDGERHRLLDDRRRRDRHGLRVLRRRRGRRRRRRRRSGFAAGAGRRRRRRRPARSDPRTGRRLIRIIRIAGRRSDRARPPSAPDRNRRTRR